MESKHKKLNLVWERQTLHKSHLFLHNREGQLFKRFVAWVRRRLHNFSFVLNTAYRVSPSKCITEIDQTHHQPRSVLLFVDAILQSLVRFDSDTGKGSADGRTGQTWIERKRIEQCIQKCCPSSVCTPQINFQLHVRRWNPHSPRFIDQICICAIASLSTYSHMDHISVSSSPHVWRQNCKFHQETPQFCYSIRPALINATDFLSTFFYSCLHKK